MNRQVHEIGWRQKCYVQFMCRGMSHRHAVVGYLNMSGEGAYVLGDKDITLSIKGCEWILFEWASIIFM